MAQTHPDRLASIATLFGMTPAPVANCRVLEVGCGNGSNLIPMAHFLPGSHFTGVDLAEEAVADARCAAGQVGLANIEFVAMNLCKIGPTMGEFDYIIAHGVYSWVPKDVRDELLAVCRQRLAPHGVACVSYNALPGSHLKTMLREMMQYHARDCVGPAEEIDRACALLRMIGNAGLVPPAWRPMIDEQIERLVTGDAGWLYHDELAPVSEAFYFRDFIAHAARHWLQYVGEAETHAMFDVKNTLDWLGDAVLEREQYIDFLRLRRFRETLICHQEINLERPPGPDRMDRFLFSSPARQVEEKIEGLNGVSITAVHEATASVCAALRRAYPLPAPFHELLQSIGRGEASREQLREILFDFIRSGFAQLHVHNFVSGVSVNSRPQASRLARWQNATGGTVTYSNHSVLTLDQMVGSLIELLDGTRDLYAVVLALAKLEGAPPPKEIRAQLPRILAHMANTGLLVDSGRNVSVPQHSPFQPDGGKLSRERPPREVSGHN